MGVIPIGSGVRYNEVVIETLARFDSSWVSPATPSIALSIRIPCQWTELACGSALSNFAERGAPSAIRDSGPGHHAVIAPYFCLWIRRRRELDRAYLSFEFVKLRRQGAPRSGRWKSSRRSATQKEIPTYDVLS